jgi:succinate dehydrogenase hydrophobic anchor subunit
VTAPRNVASAARSRPRGLLTWVVVRVTGLLLAVLVLGHFALTHILTDVSETGSSFVAERWRSAVVLGWDWLMLAAAVLHGAAGLRVIVVEYARPGRARSLSVALFGLSVAMFALGTMTILRVVAGA